MRCTPKHRCRDCRELVESGVILHKMYKHIISNEAPEQTQHDAHCWRAKLVCPVTKKVIQPKYRYGKRVN
jgi:hypothetical protein